MDILFKFFIIFQILSYFNLLYGEKACLYGINYSVRSGPDWASSEIKCKASSRILNDLTAISKLTTRIRIYSLTDCGTVDTIIQICRQLNLEIWLGIWVGPNDQVFRDEYNKLQQLIDNHMIDSRVLGIHVGSEAIYRKEVTVETSINYYQQVKQLLNTRNLSQIPVTIAEIGDTYLQNTQLIKDLEMISANAFPFWEKKTPEESIDYMIGRLSSLLTSATSKEFVLGETGWATNGNHVNASIATPTNQAVYLTNFWCKIERQRNWKYFYYSGIDDEWISQIQGHESSVESHFGLMNANLQIKENIKNLQIQCPGEQTVWQFSDTSACIRAY